jgi:NTE family protein
MPPPLGDLISSVTDTQLHRYNEDTMQLLDLSVKQWARSLSEHGHAVRPQIIEISAMGISDPEDRKFFNNVPTSLTLDDESIDRLIRIARQLVRESSEFQLLVSELN